MNDIIEGLNALINYITHASPVLLIVLLLNGLGYALKLSPLPNRLIPWVLLGVGVLLTMLVAPMPEGRNPVVLLAIMGFLFGLIAWLGHALILRRLEKFLPESIRPENDEKPQPPTTKQ